MAARQSLDALHYKRKSWGSDSLVPLFLVVTVLALLPPPAARGHDGVDGGKEGLPGINGAGAGPAAEPPQATAEDEDKVPAEALAQEEELKKLLDIPVQAWAAKTVETPDEVPAAVTVLSRVDLERWGYRNIAEALQYIAGFYLVDADILPNLPVQGFFEGLDSESGMSKLMIDGHSVAFRTTENNEPLPLSAVERIEIIRGSTSALHGADAFLGVIHIVTRAAIESRACSRDFQIQDGFIQTHANRLVSGAGQPGNRAGLELPSSSPAPMIRNIPNFTLSVRHPVAPRRRHRQRRPGRAVRQRLRASDQALF